MKDHVEIGHLTKYDAFRVNRDQAISDEEMRRCIASFLQICLAIRYILVHVWGVHVTDMPQFRGGTSESSSSYLFEGSSTSFPL